MTEGTTTIDLTHLDDDGGPGGADPVSILSVTLNTPSSGLAVSGAQPGVALQLSGTYRASNVTDTTIMVDVGGISFPATLGGTATARTWQATVRFYRAGPVTATAHAYGESSVG